MKRKRKTIQPPPDSLLVKQVDNGIDILFNDRPLSIRMHRQYPGMLVLNAGLNVLTIQPRSSNQILLKLEDL